MSNVQTQGTSYTLNIVLLMECSDLEYHRTIGFWGKSSWENNAAGLTQKNMRCCIGTETLTTYLNACEFLGENARAIHQHNAAAW